MAEKQDIDRCGMTHHFWGLLEGLGCWAIIQGDVPMKWFGGFLLALALWMVVEAANSTRRLKAAYGEHA